MYLLFNNTLVEERSLRCLIYGIVSISDLNQLWIIESAVDEGNHRGQHDLASQATQPRKHLKNEHTAQPLHMQHSNSTLTEQLCMDLFVIDRIRIVPHQRCATRRGKQTIGKLITLDDHTDCVP